MASRSATTADCAIWVSETANPYVCVEDGKRVYVRFGRPGEYDVDWEYPAWYEMRVQTNAKDEPVILGFKGREAWAEYSIAKGSSDVVEIGLDSMMLLVEDYYCEIIKTDGQRSAEATVHAVNKAAANQKDRRAPVQGDTGWQYGRPGARPAGTIAWSEHVKAWEVYHATFCNDQSAERIAERCGFGYDELVEFLGYEPKTWEPVK